MLDVPVKFAVPAIGTLLAYLNARWAIFYDWHLLSNLIKFRIKTRLAERQDRINPFYVLETLAQDPNSASRPFLVYNGRTWTYQEGYETILRYGQYLRKTLAIKPKEIVPIVFTNSANFIFIWMGLWSIGAIPAFINYNLKGNSLVHSIRAASARLVIVDEEVHMQFTDEVMAALSFPQSHGTEDPVKVVFMTPEVEASINHFPATREEDSLRSVPSRLSTGLLIYTSGTTGFPKPAIVTFDKFWSGSLFVRGWLGILPDDRIYTVCLPSFLFLFCCVFILNISDFLSQCMPLYHSTAAILGYGTTLFSGATLIIGHRFSVRRFWDEVRDNDATIIQYVGEAMRYLLAAPRQVDNVTGEDLDKKHTVRLAFGNGLRPDIWNRVKERFGIETIGEFYTATEAFSGHWNISSNDFTAGAIGRNGFLAQLLLGRSIAIVDIDYETQMPWRDPKTGLCRRSKRGQPGELIYAMDPKNISERFQGYFNNKEDTDKKVLRDVFTKGDAWFRTGDLVRWDKDGRWYFSDRIGDTFRWKSENVSTNEVAEVLGKHPEVVEANVYGVKLPHHEGRAGCAAIVFRNSSTDPPAEVLNSLAKLVHSQLPSYAKPLFLRVTAELERTGTNKQQKHILRAEGVDPSKVSSKDRLYWLRDGKYVPFGDKDWAKINAAQVRL